MFHIIKLRFFSISKIAIRMNWNFSEMFESMEALKCQPTDLGKIAPSLDWQDWQHSRTTEATLAEHLEHRGLVADGRSPSPGTEAVGRLGRASPITSIFTPGTGEEKENLD